MTTSLPFDPRSESLPSTTDTQVREALIRAELQALTEESVDMNRFRDYFEGEQSLVYSTESFKLAYGEDFEGFRDNWCEVVVNAVNDSLLFEEIAFGITDEDRETTQTLTDQIWEQFLLNDIDEQQTDHHEGILVEGVAFVIVWPKDDGGVSIDWQPGQLCRAFYDPDNRREILWAVKRWQDDFGRILVNFYTPDFIYKFYDTNTTTSNQLRSQSSSDALTEIPGVGFVSGVEPRRVPDEQFPLPNPLGVVPMVEFNNVSYRSELKIAVPQQDAINKILVDMMTASGFAAVPQRYIETMVSEPVGGWNAGAGEIMKFTPSFDAEGKAVKGTFGDFAAMSPDNFIKPVEMMLEHMALTNSTPVRYFRQIDRGGRGDAPSGESLLVDDKPLLKKIQRRQTRYGNRWIEVARLVARALEIDTLNDTPGETIWNDPRHEFRTTVLDEAVKMANPEQGLGLPLEFVIKQLGLTREEIEELDQLIEQQREEEEQLRQEEMQMQQAAFDNADSGSSGSDSE